MTYLWNYEKLVTAFFNNHFCAEKKCSSYKKKIIYKYILLTCSGFSQIYETKFVELFFLFFYNAYSKYNEYSLTWLVKLRVLLLLPVLFFDWPCQHADFGLR